MDRSTRRRATALALEVILLFFLASALAGCIPKGAPLSTTEVHPGAPMIGILHRRGTDIVDANGTAVQLRGVAFGNEVWTDREIPSTHHDEADFGRVASMGMNVVRFYLNYKTFEDDAAPGTYKPSGFEWIDRNVAWASRHGVRLILNIHVPQGGYQSNGGGSALWSTPALQERFVALWRAIAAHCASEPAIAGYDLLNEPRPPAARSQWQELAIRITKAVREVDKSHLVIVERVNSIGDDWSLDSDRNFFLTGDENTAYTFHFYSPIEYTHQKTPWTTFGEGGKYPDPGNSNRNRAYLEAEIDKDVAWGRAHGVPLYLGEFGLHRPCFEDGRGGLAWVSDMLDILIERRLHFTYHAYHEDAFGLFYGYGSLPDPARANQPLVELIAHKLAPPAPPR